MSTKKIYSQALALHGRDSIRDSRGGGVESDVERPRIPLAQSPFQSRSLSLSRSQSLSLWHNARERPHTTRDHDGVERVGWSRAEEMGGEGKRDLERVEDVVERADAVCCVEHQHRLVVAGGGCLVFVWRVRVLFPAGAEESGA
eukprot:130582-Rhodomonas_salina.1